MAFIIDKQTLVDLKIFNKPQSDSIFGIYNKTQTRGSAKILEDMFRYPLSDADKIGERISIFEYFMGKDIWLEDWFNSEWFDAIEHYLSDTDQRSKLKAHDNSLRRRINRIIGADIAYSMIQKAILSTISVCKVAERWANQLSDAPAPLQREREELSELLKSDTFAWVNSVEAKHLDYKKVAHYDELLRYQGILEFRRLLEILYRIDTYRSVAKVGVNRGYVLPKVLTNGEEELYVKDLRYPLLDSAISNTVSIRSDQKVVFLTGANMAGKSTFMKSFGIVIFLAHMGFPVPASEMSFSVFNGMYTTINLPDNMHVGLSHFYAEVRRLRKVADQVNRFGKFVVIFDELFRGTNVKDAHEATVEVMKAFASRNDTVFMISTHIIEAGEELKSASDEIKFVYFPTIMNPTGKPTYTYKLSEGISSDRHGMMIIKNEKIIEILNSKP